jgi:endoglucanase
MRELIKKLVETPGPSGSEELIRKAVIEEIKGYVDEYKVDALGNLIARKGTKKADGLRIMISAHIDEIGLMVTHVDTHGFVRFIGIGGINPLTCLGGRVLFMNGTRGVIGTEKLDAGKAPTLDQLFIDVGASDRESCPVKVGDVCGFERPYVEYGDRLVAKSMDDRIAAVVAIEALKALKKTPHEVHFVFSVQEEVGIRGATTAAYGVDPDLGLAIDVTRSGDTPQDDQDGNLVGQGRGDQGAGPILHRRPKSGQLDGRDRQGGRHSLPDGSARSRRDRWACHPDDARRRAGRVHLDRLPIHPLAVRDGRQTRPGSRHPVAGGAVEQTGHTGLRH